MNVKQIKIRNILGIEELEIQPGKITAISGKNGAGKSSIIEAIKSVFAGGQDITLLRQGTTVGEVGLLLDDGTELTRRVTTKGSSLVVAHPTLGKVSKAQAAVEQLALIQSVNPVQFLLLPSKKRTEYLLEICPITIDSDWLASVYERSGKKGEKITESPSLEDVTTLRQHIYDLRTAANGTAREKAILIEQIASSLPSEKELNTDFSAEVLALEHQISAAEEWSQLEFSRIDKMEKEMINAARVECNQRTSEAEELWRSKQAEIHKKIDALQQELSNEQAKYYQSINDIQNIELENRHSIEGSATAEKSQIQQTLHSTISPLKSQLATLREKEKNLAAHRKTEEIVAQLKNEVTYSEERAQYLTSLIGEIDSTKKNLLSRLPIEGLEIVDGEIYRHGIHFDRLNTAQRVEIAFQLALLNTQSLPLMYVDNAECLDNESLLHLSDMASQAEVQLIVSMVSDDVLTISTID